MSLGNFKRGTGKKFAGFLGKQGFYLLMIACIGIIGVTALVSSLSNGGDNEINNYPSPTPTDKPASNQNPIIENPNNSAAKVIMRVPVSGDILRPYAMESLVYSATLNQWQTHSGVDIKAEEGTNVVAALDGKVKSVTNDALMGNTVVIEHNGGLVTVYASLKSTAIKENDTVTKGQTIGAVGTTASFEVSDGPHLHFEVKLNGDNVSPMDYFAAVK
ncbi:MAG TPA: M23 family metallopeptidase [Clostridia bacterium]|nr:M23 family metallopeptidase [Clostridia bacterium]